MLDLFMPSDLFALGILGLVAPLLGVCRSLTWTRVGIVLSVVTVTVSGTTAWLLKWPALIPGLATAVSLLYAVSLIPDGTRQRVVQFMLARPVVVAALTAGSLLAAGGWIAHVVERTLTPALNPSDLLPPFTAIEGTDLPDPAYTDRGRSVRLLGFPPSDDADAEELRRHEQWYSKLHEMSLIRIAPADRLSNCHGWVFTNGHYNLHSEDIDIILEDNGYRVVSEPIVGDLVVFRDGLDRVTHTGVVRLVLGRLILIESKWGHLGVYLHPVEEQPYGNDWSFMRSDRPNHLLRLSPPDTEGAHMP